MFKTLNRLGRAGRIFRGAVVYILVLQLAPWSVRANPVGGSVIAGQANISGGAGTLTVNQASQRAIINWQDFSIQHGELTRFVQPSAASAVLNRVVGSNLSGIYGTLQSNGQVYLINPNGIVIGSTGVINTGGFVASTLDVDNSQFMGGGDLTFKGNSTAKVVNLGKIGADSGDVILIAQQVENAGEIKAPNGKAGLAAGNEVLVKASGQERLFVQAGKGSVSNSGLIESATAELKAAGGNEYALAINNTGTMRAVGMVNEGGRILLKAGTGAVRNSGTLTAKGAKDAKPEVKVLGKKVELADTSVIEAAGGFVETSGDEVMIADGARVTTLAEDGSFGNWLIDPTDFYVTAGNAGPTSSGIGANTLSGILGSTNVLIQTLVAGSESGDIYVNAPVSWSANTSLALSANGDIFINASIAASGASGKLALEYGRGAVAAGNTATYVLNNGVQVNLQAGSNFSTKLGSDGSTLNYTVITSLGGVGSVTGTDLQGINGNLSGLYALGADIDASATSGWNSGAGFAPIGTFSGTFAGLGHAIRNVSINRPVDNVGLFGVVQGTIRETGLVEGSVVGLGATGGLVGLLQGGLVDRSYSTVSVQGTLRVGGLVGYNQGRITQSYSTGDVTGTNGVGGLVGATFGGAVIEQSYATGAVTGPVLTAGLVGTLNTGATLRESFATGRVTSTFASNGLTAGGSGTITNSYWATDTTGQSGTAGGGVGMTLAQLEAALPAGFDPSVWGNAGNQSTPYIKAIALSHAYIGSDPGTANLYRILQNVDQLQAMSNNLAGNYALGNNIDASATSGWNGGLGFAPVGDNSGYFTGRFDGLGYTINSLTINRPSQNYVGLFGAILNGAKIRDVGLVGGSMTGQNSVGALAGYSYFGDISQSFMTGNVTGTGFNVGDLVGYNQGTINQSYTTGNITGGDFAGGIAGANYGSIDQSYATGNVTGGQHAGGLVGLNYGGVNQSYATGNVTGTDVVAGLVGLNYGNIDQSCATGDVTGTSETGGLVGVSLGSITSSYRNTDASISSGGNSLGTGLTLAQLEAGLPSGFDSSIWGNAGNHSTPYVKTIALSHAYIDSDPGTTNLYRIIQNVDQLQLLNEGLVGNYALGNDIDATATAGWNGGEGFIPIGGTPNPFTGKFDGIGYTIDGLTINRPGSDSQALFAAIHRNSSIRNLALTNVSVSGGRVVAGLVASNLGSISNIYVSGTVTGVADSVGALIGFNNSATISNIYSSAAVSADSNVGGLVGINANGGTISNSYASGTVSGTTNTGGLVGWNVVGSSISDSYATGAVTGTTATGGLVGANGFGGTINNSYATGAVSGTDKTGALVGDNVGTVTNSFWDTTLSALPGIGNGTTTGATGLTTTAFQNTSGFMASATTWDFDNVWMPSSAGYYPELYTLSNVIYVTTPDATRTYGDANPVFTPTVHGGPGVYVFGPSGDSLTVTVGGSVTTASSVGDYAIEGSSTVTSTLSQSYRALYDGTLTVEARAITITADGGQGKVYGNADPGLTYTVGGMDLVNGDLLSGSLERVSGESLGDYAITQGTLAASSNYAVTYTGNNFGITARPITVTASSGQGKTYGDTDPALTYSITAGSLVGTDSLSGVLTRVAGEDVGSYAIKQGSLDVSTNYMMTYVADNFGITPRSITVKARSGTSNFGTTPANPGVILTEGSLAFAETLDSLGIGNDFNITGSSSVGRYLIHVTGDNANYAITRVNGNWEVLSVLSPEPVNPGAGLDQLSADFQSSQANDENTVVDGVTGFGGSGEGTLSFNGQGGKKVPGAIIQVSSGDVP